MRTIYFLELANSKYFLLAKREPVLNIPHFFLESILKYNYLKTNNPIRIIDEYPEIHPLDLDTLVKKHMLSLGIDNVRGGSYSTTFLDKGQTAFLTRELFPTKKCPEGECPDEVIKEILDKYGSGYTDESEEKRTQLKNNYEKFKKEKKMLESIQIDTQLYRTQLDWILKKCQEQITASRYSVLYQILNREDIKTYREILPIFNKIYQTFLTIYEKPVDPIYTDVLVKHPEFALDDFIYHGHRTQLPISIERVEQLIFKYIFFLTYIENRLAELEFDVSSWGSNAEYIFPRAIYFLGLTKERPLSR
jgi:hypothetical protein